MKAFGYIRVSGIGQVDGDGPARQEESVTRFCTAQKLEFAGRFVEGGVSGTVEAMDRPQFVEMLETIEKRCDNGPAGEEPDGPYCIVVERIDRLARDLMISEVLLGECRKRNIPVYCVDQGVLVDMASDGGDPTRKLLRQLLAALAEWEKSVIVKKLRISRDRMRQREGRCEGRKPYGHTPEEKANKDWIIGQRGLGASPVRIARRLNEFGKRTRSGKPWNRFSVNNVLTERGLAKNQKEKSCVVQS